MSTCLSEAALEFCQKNLSILRHLSVHGSITTVTDHETTISYYSRECHSVKGRWKSLVFYSATALTLQLVIHKIKSEFDPGFPCRESV